MIINLKLTWDSVCTLAPVIEIKSIIQTSQFINTHLFLLQCWIENAIVIVTKITVTTKNPIIAVEIITTKLLCTVTAWR